MEIHTPCIFNKFNYQFPNQLMTWLAPLDPAACEGRTKGIKCLGFPCFSRKWYRILNGHSSIGHCAYQGCLPHSRKMLPTTVNKILLSIMLKEIQSLKNKQTKHSLPRRPPPQVKTKQNPNQLAVISAIHKYSLANKTHFHIFLLIG